MFWWQGGGEKKGPNLSTLNTVSRQLQGEGACEDDTEKQDAAGFVKFCNLWTLPQKKTPPKTRKLYALPAWAIRRETRFFAHSMFLEH